MMRAARASRAAMLACLPMLIGVGCSLVAFGEPPAIHDAGYVRPGSRVFDKVATLTAGRPYDLVVLVSDPDGDLAFVSIETDGPDGYHYSRRYRTSADTVRTRGQVFEVTAPREKGLYEIALVPGDAGRNVGDAFTFGVVVTE